MTSAMQDPHVFRSIAVLSGKGGSGKTLIAAAAAFFFADHFVDAANPGGGPVILMDADVGTAGLSYYLGLRYVHNIGDGFAEHVMAATDRDGQYDPSAHAVRAFLRPLTHIREDISIDKRSRRIMFLPMGDNAVLMRSSTSGNIPEALRAVVRNLAKEAGRLVVDCRGGIDEESLAVCSEVDDILLVVEPDTTSVQATKHLVDVLAAKDLTHKIRGFIINKAMEDPSVVARNGSGLFRTRALASVPFDIDANRAFLIGELPAHQSLFSLHVQDGLSRVYPEIEKPPANTIWQPSDFDQLALLTPESARGGTVAGTTLLALAVSFAANEIVTKARTPSTTIAIVIMIALVGLIGSLDPARRLVGRLAGGYRRSRERPRRR